MSDFAMFDEHQAAFLGHLQRDHGVTVREFCAATGAEERTAYRIFGGASPLTVAQLRGWIDASPDVGVRTALMQFAAGEAKGMVAVCLATDGTPTDPDLDAAEAIESVAHLIRQRVEARRDGTLDQTEHAEQVAQAREAVRIAHQLLHAIECERPVQRRQARLERLAHAMTGKPRLVEPADQHHLAEGA